MKVTVREKYKEIYSKINEYFQNLFNSYPAFLMLLNAVCVISITQFCFSDTNDHNYYSFAVLSSIFLVFINIIILKKNFIKLTINLIFIAIVSISSLSRINSFNQNNLLIPNNLYAKLIVKITDYSSCGDEISFLNNPKLIKAKIIKVLEENTPDTIPLEGKNIFIRLPKNFQKISFNNLLKISGNLRKNSNSIIKYKYDFTNNKNFSKKYDKVENGFNNYLRTKNICGIFSVDEATIIKKNKNSTVSLILSARNFIINRLCKYLEAPQQKTLICAMFFGIKQNLSTEDKKNFINNGIIHLFTVSGLHAAMVALIISLLFRIIPFRFRYSVIICALICYLIMTGNNPPAVRAITMISTVLFFKVFRLKTPILNTLALTAAFFLTINPFLINDLGFNYSFIVVFFLIIYSKRFQNFSLILFEKSNYLTDHSAKRKYIFKAKILNKFFAFTTGCLVAFLASNVISIHNYKAFFGIALLVNILLFPLVWIIYAVVAIQLLGFYSDTLLYYTSKINGVLINAIFSISDYFSRNFIPEPTGKIPIIQLTLILILLMCIIICKRRVAIASLIIFLGLISWNYSSSLLKTKKGRIFVISQSSDYSPVIIIMPKNSYRYTIINSGNFTISNVIKNICKKYGVSKQLNFTFSGVKKSELQNSIWLLKNLKVDNLFLIKTTKLRSKYAKELLAFCSQNKQPIKVFNKIMPRTDDKRHSQRYCYSSKFFRQNLVVTKNLGYYSYKYNFNFNKDNVRLIHDDFVLEVDGLNRFGQGKIDFQTKTNNLNSKKISLQHDFYSNQTAQIVEIIF